MDPAPFNCPRAFAASQADPPTADRLHRAQLCGAGEESVSATRWKARIPIGRRPPIAGRPRAIFARATIASVSRPRTTAACGMKPARRSISPAPRHTTRPPGSAPCVAWRFGDPRSGLPTTAALPETPVQHAAGRARGGARTHRARAARYAAAELSRHAHEAFRGAVTDPGAPRRPGDPGDDSPRRDGRRSQRAGMRCRDCVPPQSSPTTWYARSPLSENSSPPNGPA